ncbi:hypothetical protein DEU56DRAFT_962934 [Suillus clintonianus]|uniref:uncharacterized protein n=1 Tax=Suillus clintonianus TaxID=1904413 RepID=UPI001B87C407|nr:uncharacterized protein DEU56DRAFT_962934 [Suillus clintonianus]KAG2125132.1 hypothetical protein DEU56DRAFT_962934 [Suillus clintonianus]
MISPTWSCSPLTQLWCELLRLSQSACISFGATSTGDCTSMNAVSAFVSRNLSNVLHGQVIVPDDPPPLELLCGHVSQAFAYEPFVAHFIMNDLGIPVKTVLKGRIRRAWLQLVRCAPYPRCLGSVYGHLRSNSNSRAYAAQVHTESKPCFTQQVDVVNWCETFDKSTGWYDHVLSETVLEAIAFGWHTGPDGPPTQWFCIDSSAHEIASCMEQYIRKNNKNAIAFNSRVTAIGVNKDNTGMDVVTDNKDHRVFSHVISTIPLPALRTIDLSKAGLSPMQSNALRMLNYGPSVKIGMQFRTAWWTTGTDLNRNPPNIVGGQTYTDMPLCAVVYPSFGRVQAGTTTALIASYCWMLDATRWGALIGKHDVVSNSL